MDGHRPRPKEGKDKSLGGKGTSASCIHTSVAVKSIKTYFEGFQTMKDLKGVMQGFDVR